MNAQQIAGVRDLLTRATAAGWKRGDRSRVNGIPVLCHWWRDDLKLYVGYEKVHVLGSSAEQDWNVPIASVEQVAAVLELAGVLPRGRKVLDGYGSI